MVASNELRRFLDALDSRRQRMLRFADANAQTSGDDPSQLHSDLTELREQLVVADEELRVQQEQLDQNRNLAAAVAGGYATLIQCTSDALVLTNESGAVLSASAQAQSLIAPVLGAAPRPIANWFTMPDRGAIRSAISTLKRSADRSVDLGTLTLRAADGPGAEVSVTAVVVLRLSDEQFRLVWSLTPVRVPGPTTEVTGERQVGGETDPGGLLIVAGQRLSTSRSLDDVLQSIIDGARSCFRAATFIDIYLADRQAAGRRRRWSDIPAQHLNDLQRGLGEGPALDALEGQETISADLPSDPRWPRLATVVPAALRASLTIPLYGEDRPAAALMLLSDRPHAFDIVDRQAVRLFGVQAGLALERTLTEESLRVAIRRREIVGPAIGVLAERYRIDTGAAMDALREASRTTNVKVTELASEILRTGRVPESVKRLIRTRTRA